MGPENSPFCGKNESRIEKRFQTLFQSRKLLTRRARSGKVRLIPTRRYAERIKEVCNG
jgi:hypothetical protein